ncbi:MAG TPA: hypothetical protein VN327_04490 [Pseudonocardiaceae bacterium]|nr:hypothetical protein [Pseudonocardiaceae bacterium]
MVPVILGRLEWIASGNSMITKPHDGVLTVEGGAVMVLILGLLVLWLVLVVVGFAIKTLLWLAIVGLVLFVITGVFGAIRGRSGRALR